MVARSDQIRAWTRAATRPRRCWSRLAAPFWLARQGLRGLDRFQVIRKAIVGRRDSPEPHGQRARLVTRAPPAAAVAVLHRPANKLAHRPPGPPTLIRKRAVLVLP